MATERHFTGYFDNRPLPVVKYPFVRFVFIFAAGILSALLLDFRVNAWLFFPLLGLYVVILSVTRSHSFVMLKSLIGLTLLFLFGAYVVHLHQPQKYQLPQEQVLYVGVIDDEPVVKKTVRATLLLEAYIDTAGRHELEGKMMVYFYKDSLSSSLTYGDKVFFQTKARKLVPADNPFLFDYPKYLMKQGIFYTAYIDSSSWMKTEGFYANRLQRFANDTRRKLMALYQKAGFSGEKYNVLAALTLGYKQGLDRETSEKFAVSGAMHILAVSGLHVGIIYLILVLLLKPLKLTKKGKILYLLLVTLSLWGFALLTGLSPSVKRSAFMFSLIALADISGKKSYIYNTLAAAAFFMLAFSPSDILNVGFWLSYLAVFAIVYLQPKIYHLLYFRNFLLDKLWGLVSVSVAAQFGTFPLSLYVFHKFPVYFILTNILVIPLASVILYSAVLLLAFSWFEPLFYFFAKILDFALTLLLSSVDFIQSLPASSLQDIHFSFMAMLLLYVFIFALALIFIKRQKIFVYFTLLSLIGFSLTRIYDKITFAGKEKFVVYSVAKHSLFLYPSLDSAYIFADSSLIAQNKVLYNVMPYLQRAGIEKYRVINLDSIHAGIRGQRFLYHKGFASINGKLIYIANDDSIAQYKTQKVMKIDYLLLRNSLSLAEIDNLLTIIEPETIVIDGSFSTYKIKQLTNTCQRKNIKLANPSQECIFIE